MQVIRSNSTERLSILSEANFSQKVMAQLYFLSFKILTLTEKKIPIEKKKIMKMIEEKKALKLEAKMLLIFVGFVQRMP